MMNYYVNPSLPFLTLTMNILNRNVIQNTVKHPIKKSFHKCLLNHHDSVMIDNKSKKNNNAIYGASLFFVSFDTQ